MASRESFAIINYWKYPRNKRGQNNYSSFKYCHKKEQLKLRLSSVWYLILNKIIRGSRWERKMVWNDNFRIPFYKRIGCRITKHNWYYLDDDEMAFCTKCYKRTEHISKEQWDRMEKLKSIKKRIKN